MDGEAWEIKRLYAPSFHSDAVGENGNFIVPYFGDPALDDHLLLVRAFFIPELPFGEYGYKRHVARQDAEFADLSRGDDLVHPFVNDETYRCYYLQKNVRQFLLLGSGPIPAPDS